MANLKHLSTLISSLELRNLSKTHSFLKNYRLLEAGVGEAAKKNYSEGHITDQAAYIDTLKCTEPTRLYPRNLPEVKCFQEYASDLGLSNSHHLILYDRSPFGFYASSRMWWIFRVLFGHEKVSILNGGLNNWVKNGFELSTKTPNFTKENFWVAKERKELKKDFEQIQKNIKSDKEQVVDVRGSADFEAEHIPYSLNLPYSDLFDKNTGLIKTKDELLKLFKEKDIDISKPLIASCMTGMTATSLALATYLTGLKDTSVYYGSWTEYSQRT